MAGLPAHRFSAGSSASEQANAGNSAARRQRRRPWPSKPREVADWIERAARDDAKAGVLDLWRRNGEALGCATAATRSSPVSSLDQAAALPVGAAVVSAWKNGIRAGRERQRLSARETGAWRRASRGRKEAAALRSPHPHDLVRRQADHRRARRFLRPARILTALFASPTTCAIPMRLLGRLVNLTGLVIPPDEIAALFHRDRSARNGARGRNSKLLLLRAPSSAAMAIRRRPRHTFWVSISRSPSTRRSILPGAHRRDPRAGRAGHRIAICTRSRASGARTRSIYQEHVDELRARCSTHGEIANRDDPFNPVGLQAAALHRQQRSTSPSTSIPVEDAALVREGSRGDQAVYPAQSRRLTDALSDRFGLVIAKKRLFQQPWWPRSGRRIGASG